MKVLVILAHPDRQSFNHAIAQTAVDQIKKNGHECIFHDLYAEKFDPIVSADEISEEADLPHMLKLHCKEISKAQGIIIIHPNWWGQPPAILKGWVDRVLRPGVAYRFLEGDKGEGVPLGLLRANAALVFNTSNTLSERELHVFGDPLEMLWKKCIFELCGVKAFYRETFSIIITSSIEQRQEWLKKVRAVINQYFPGV
jgi:NAD(P)H dehydrogenase (quinone)